MLVSNKEVIEEIIELEQYKETLDYVCEERVFGIEKSGDKIVMAENCDGYFAVILTPKLCNDLSEIFKILAKNVVEE